MESTIITIPRPRYDALVKKEVMLDTILANEMAKPDYDRDKLLAAFEKIFTEGLLEC